MSQLTPKAVAFITGVEGLILEAYKDSKGIWTWSNGIAETSGYDVLQFKDKPSDIEFALREGIKFMEKKYLPAVLRAFGDHPLTDNQLAAAISFHWNTGAIASATWVKDFLKGNVNTARSNFMAWRKPAAIIGRRTTECELFFDAKWPSSLNATIWSVAKPSYKPVSPKSVNVMPILQQIMTGG